MVIGLVGHTGAGKSMYARFLHMKYGERVTIMKHSDRLKTIAAKRGLPDDALTLGEIWKEISLERGIGWVSEDVCAQITADIPDAPSRIVVVDGIRNLSEIACYRELPDFAMVKVRAAQSIRYARVRNRAERTGEREMTWDEFLAIENSPSNQYIPALLLMQGYDIENERHQYEYVLVIERLFDHILRDLAERQF